jgi:hypothetical protein
MFRETNKKIQRHRPSIDLSIVIHGQFEEIDL